MKTTLVLTLVLLGLMPNFLVQPTTDINTTQNLVISPNGLRMRDQPSLKSKVVMTVPFKERVKILSDKSYGFQKIGKYEFTSPIESEGTTSSYDLSIEGHWVKASYNGKTGYLFNAYLDYSFGSDGTNDSYTKFGCNKEVVLLFTGSDCYDNRFYNPTWNWYGIYKIKGKVSLKPVKMGFFVTNEELTSIGISTNDNEYLGFIIGSKKALKTGELEGSLFGSYANNLFEKDGKLDNDFLQKHELSIEKEKEEMPYMIRGTIIHKVGNQTQILNPKEAGFSDEPVSILWAGDLDNDGKTDYIIDYGEASQQSILYLSSMAEEGELVKAVAVYRSGYCC